jgi:hypothetical protein
MSMQIESKDKHAKHVWWPLPALRSSPVGRAQDEATWAPK